jgi:hypothetical protein
MKTNWLAVIAAAIAHFFLGAVWFSGMKSAWLAGVGKTEQELMQQGSPAMAYSIAFVCNLIMALVLAKVIAASGRWSATGGMRVGLVLGFGLAFTAMVTELVFEARSGQFLLIAGGYPVVGCMVMGAILGAWKPKGAASG